MQIVKIMYSRTVNICKNVQNSPGPYRQVRLCITTTHTHEPYIPHYVILYSSLAKRCRHYMLIVVLWCCLHLCTCHMFPSFFFLCCVLCLCFLFLFVGHLCLVVLFLFRSVCLLSFLFVLSIKRKLEKNR